MDTIKRILGDIFSIFRRTLDEWNTDRAPQLAASLAYYTLFSLAPLLLIAIAIAGVIFGQNTARAEVLGQIERAVGPDTAGFIESLLVNASQPGAGIAATIFSIVSLILGAAGVFGQIKIAMQIIWNVNPEPPPNGLRAILRLVKDQSVSVLMVLGTGFLLLASLLLNAILANISSVVNSYLAIQASWWQVVNFFVSFGVITLLFAAIFKYVPGIRIKWTDVLPGAALTALLFTIGRTLLGLYLGLSSVSTVYGAAGSLVVLLLWVYYSAQVLFFGAEFAQVYAKTYGSLRDKDDTDKAQSVTPETRKADMKYDAQKHPDHHQSSVGVR
jgi:membrane protein